VASSPLLSLGWLLVPTVSPAKVSCLLLPRDASTLSLSPQSASRWVIALVASSHHCNHYCRSCIIAIASMPSHYCYLCNLAIHAAVAVSSHQSPCRHTSHRAVAPFTMSLLPHQCPLVIFVICHCHSRLVAISHQRFLHQCRDWRCCMVPIFIIDVLTLVAASCCAVENCLSSMWSLSSSHRWCAAHTVIIARTRSPHTHPCHLHMWLAQIKHRSHGSPSSLPFLSPVGSKLSGSFLNALLHRGVQMPHIRLLLVPLSTSYEIRQSCNDASSVGVVISRNLT